MGKHKTRQGKKLADLKRVLAKHQEKAPEAPKISKEKQQEKPTYSFTPATTFIKSTQQPGMYAYVTHDLIKTTILSFSIIAFQFLLFFLLRMHVVKIPGIGY